jgi:hypothetical protein
VKNTIISGVNNNGKGAAVVGKLLTAPLTDDWWMIGTVPKNVSLCGCELLKHEIKIGLINDVLHSFPSPLSHLPDLLG